MVVETDDYKVIKGKIEEIQDNSAKLSKSEYKRRLNQMINTSDICIEVVDAREPFNFRSKELENNILIKNKKKLVILINKADLVSKENLQKWQKLFKRDQPTLLFSAKELSEKTAEEILEHPYYTELIDILRQLSNTENKKVSICLLGYPNTGKQTILDIFKKLNFKLFKTNVDGLYEFALENVAKQNQHETHYKLRLLSFPGILATRSEMGLSIIPKSTKDVEEIKDPLVVLKDLFKFVSKEELLELYEIPLFEDLVEFLDNICKKNNFMIKKGYPNMERAAKYVIQDIISGKVKFESMIDEE